MSAELPLTFAVSQRPTVSHSFADTALKAAARFWFVVAATGQLLFAFTIAAFYGLTALRGELSRWNKFVTNGHVPGDTMSNFAVAVHLISAVLIIVAGAAQLIPRIRDRFPRFHRWNGRVYMLTAVTVTVAGLYMLWFRGGAGDLWQRLGATLNAVLIWLCAFMALRYAVARNFKVHRRWALRLFLVVSGVWFFRVAFFLVLLVFKGPIGFDPTTFSGPLPTLLVFGQTLVPLAVLELYLYAQDNAGAVRRMATAAILFVLTLGMGAGIFAVTVGAWVPRVAAAFDARTSIAETISATMASRGIDQAALRYRQLKAAKSPNYNFEERELNGLGYQLIHKKQLKEAIRILELNVEAYPRSSNVYDSLGEAYLTAGNKPLAIVNYQKSLQLNPKNGGAVIALQKLGARP